MDPKILEVLKKILANPNDITEPFRIENEYYFRFKGVTFSILFNPDRQAKYGAYSFYVYPTYSGPLNALHVKFSVGGVEEAPAVSSFNSGTASAEGIKLMQLLWDKLNEIKPTDLDQAIRKVLEG